MSNLTRKRLSTDFGDIIYYYFESENSFRFNVFIHGLGGNQNWFFSDFETFELDEFSWIIPNLMGYGESSKYRNAKAYTMDQQAEFLLQIIQHEKVKEIAILAHSMGGLVAISLIEKLATQEEQNIKLATLLYLEGPLDVRDAIITPHVISVPLDEFERGFDSWCTYIQDGSHEPFMLEWIDDLREAGPFVIWESSKDCVRVSERGGLLERILTYSNLPVFFIFGEKNKGRYSSEKLARNAGLPIHYIPNTGHAMFRENPSSFWRLVKKLLQ